MKILFVLACAALAVMFFQNFGDYFDPYMTKWWIFAPAHFTAGLFLGILGMYLAHGLRWQKALVPVLVLVIFVGIAWEIMEYALFIDLHWYDTALDIMLDMLGGYAGYRLIGEHRA